jgi:hypothetical protein
MPLLVIVMEYICLGNFLNKLGLQINTYLPKTRVHMSHDKRNEMQRDRLCLYLSDAKDIKSKIAIERLIADIDFKLIGAIEKINHNESRFWDEILIK